MTLRLENKSLVLKFFQGNTNSSDSLFETLDSETYTFSVLCPFDADRGALTSGPWSHPTNFYIGKLDKIRLWVGDVSHDTPQEEFENWISNIKLNIKTERLYFLLADGSDLLDPMTGPNLVTEPGGYPLPHNEGVGASGAWTLREDSYEVDSFKLSEDGDYIESTNWNEDIFFSVNTHVNFTINNPNNVPLLGVDGEDQVVMSLADTNTTKFPRICFYVDTTGFLIPHHIDDSLLHSTGFGYVSFKNRPHQFTHCGENFEGSGAVDETGCPYENFDCYVAYEQGDYPGTRVVAYNGGLKNYSNVKFSQNMVRTLDRPIAFANIHDYIKFYRESSTWFIDATLQEGILKLNVGGDVATDNPGILRFPGYAKLIELDQSMLLQSIGTNESVPTDMGVNVEVQDDDIVAPTFAIAFTFPDELLETTNILEWGIAHDYVELSSEQTGVSIDQTTGVITMSNWTHDAPHHDLVVEVNYEETLSSVFSEPGGDYVCVSGTVVDGEVTGGEYGILTDEDVWIETDDIDGLQPLQRLFLLEDTITDFSLSENVGNTLVVCGRPRTSTYTEGDVGVLLEVATVRRKRYIPLSLQRTDMSSVDYTPVLTDIKIFNAQNESEFAMVSPPSSVSVIFPRGGAEYYEFHIGGHSEFLGGFDDGFVYWGLSTSSGCRECGDDASPGGGSLDAHFWPLSGNEISHRKGTEVIFTKVSVCEDGSTTTMTSSAEVDRYRSEIQRGFAAGDLWNDLDMGEEYDSTATWSDVVDLINPGQYEISYQSCGEHQEDVCFRDLPYIGGPCPSSYMSAEYSQIENENYHYGPNSFVHRMIPSSTGCWRNCCMDYWEAGYDMSEVPGCADFYDDHIFEKSDLATRWSAKNWYVLPEHDVEAIKKPRSLAKEKYGECRLISHLRMDYRKLLNDGIDSHAVFNNTHGTTGDDGYENTTILFPIDSTRHTALFTTDPLQGELRGGGSYDGANLPSYVGTSESWCDDLPTVESPVCGEDGNTYKNAAYAVCAGVRIVDYDDGCVEEITDVDPDPYPIGSDKICVTFNHPISGEVYESHSGTFTIVTGVLHNNRPMWSNGVVHIWWYDSGDNKYWIHTEEYPIGDEKFEPSHVLYRESVYGQQGDSRFHACEIPSVGVDYPWNVQHWRHTECDCSQHWLTEQGKLCWTETYEEPVIVNECLEEIVPPPLPPEPRITIEDVKVTDAVENVELTILLTDADHWHYILSGSNDMVRVLPEDGYTTSFTVSPGVHEITVYAVDEEHQILGEPDSRIFEVELDPSIEINTIETTNAPENNVTMTVSLTSAPRWYYKLDTWELDTTGFVSEEDGNTITFSADPGQHTVTVYALDEEMQDITGVTDSQSFEIVEFVWQDLQKVETHFYECEDLEWVNGCGATDAPDEGSFGYSVELSPTNTSIEDGRYWSPTDTSFGLGQHLLMKGESVYVPRELEISTEHGIVRVTFKGFILSDGAVELTPMGISSISSVGKAHTTHDGDVKITPCWVYSSREFQNALGTDIKLKFSGLPNDGADVNCAGDFGEWSDCVGCGPTGIKRRDFVATIKPKNNGTPCPDPEIVSCEGDPCPVDCEVSKWTEWSICSKECGTGEQNRTRTITTAAQHGGEECPTLEEKKECNTNPCPVNCEVSNWGDWGDCSVTCGVGVKKRQRVVTQFAEHGGVECPALEEVVECSNDPCPVDCEVSDWTDWSECTKECGTGDQKRTRKIIVHPLHDGDECPTPLTETRDCNTQPCPVDCIPTVWSEWGPCLDDSNAEVTCGGGITTRTRTIETDEQHGGVCPERKVLSESRPCKTHSCDADCKGEWGEWSPCIAENCDAETGTRTRTYTITRHKGDGGQDCQHESGHTETASCTPFNCTDSCLQESTARCKFYAKNGTEDETSFNLTIPGTGGEHELKGKGRDPWKLTRKDDPAQYVEFSDDSELDPELEQNYFRREGYASCIDYAPCNITNNFFIIEFPETMYITDVNAEIYANWWLRGSRKYFDLAKHGRFEVGSKSKVVTKFSGQQFSLNDDIQETIQGKPTGIFQGESKAFEHWSYPSTYQDDFAQEGNFVSSISLIEPGISWCDSSCNVTDHIFSSVDNIFDYDLNINYNSNTPVSEDRWNLISTRRTMPEVFVDTILKIDPGEYESLKTLRGPRGKHLPETPGWFPQQVSVKAEDMECCAEVGKWGYPAKAILFQLTSLGRPSITNAYWNPKTGNYEYKITDRTYGATTHAVRSIENLPFIRGFAASDNIDITEPYDLMKTHADSCDVTSRLLVVPKGHNAPWTLPLHITDQEILPTHNKFPPTG